jgi:iron complex outermembrane receptor protein
LVGDGQFSPEQLIGYELGYRTYVKGGGFISASGFYNQYDDLLSVENRPPTVETSPSPTHLVLPIFLRNGIRATTAGFELASLWDVRRWWRVRGSYSYMNLNAKRKPDSNDASTVAQLEGDSPRHSGVVQNYLSLPGALELSLTYRYVGALKGPDQRVNAYSTGDAVLSKRVTRNLELSIAGRNLFQPSHPEYAGEPGGLVGIRRSAYLRFAWVK